MALPNLTAEQRSAALEKAMAVRRLRAELKRDLKSGKLTIEDVIEGESHIAQQMLVRQLLESLPGWGRTKSERLMLQVGITPNRRVRGLGVRQKRELLAHFGHTTFI